MLESETNFPGFCLELLRFFKNIHKSRHIQTSFHELKSAAIKRVNLHEHIQLKSAEEARFGIEQQQIKTQIVKRAENKN
jgi:hypothetical protein